MCVTGICRVPKKLLPKPAYLETKEYGVVMILFLCPLWLNGLNYVFKRKDRKKREADGW